MKSSKNKTTLLCLLIAFFFCISSPTNAQYIFPLSTFSTGSAASAVSNKLSAQVNVSQGELLTFFNGLFSNSGSQLEGVRPTISSLNAPTMTLDWSPIEGSTSYNIAYKNLSEPGDEGLINTTETSYTFNNLPQRLYLFAFYAEVNGITSNRVNFIIVDLDLSIIIDNDIFIPTEEEKTPNDKEEGCPDEIPIDVSTNTDHEYSIGFEWTNPCPITNYRVVVERVNANGNSYQSNYEVEYKKSLTVGGTDLVRIASVGTNPGDPGDPPLGNHHVGRNNQYEVLLTTNYFTVIFPHQDKMEFASVEAFQCACAISSPPGDVKGIRKVDAINPKLQPNPVFSIGTLRYELDEPSDTHIYLVDATMRKRQTLLSATQQARGPHQLDIDMQHLSAGVYYCVIQTQYQQKSIKIIKVD
ncbi:MAG: T9SS type A sorting domain-containing protein [Bacteroidota bacterium]